MNLDELSVMDLISLDLSIQWEILTRIYPLILLALCIFLIIKINMYNIEKKVGK